MIKRREELNKPVQHQTACWFLAWLWQKPSLRLFATIGLLIGGWISLASAFFPVYGLIALLAAIVLFIDWATRQIWPDARAMVR